jgi:hypothetical protein
VSLWARFDGLFPVAAFDVGTLPLASLQRVCALVSSCDA